MGPSLRRSLWLVVFCALALFSAAALAQDTTGDSTPAVTTGDDRGSDTAQQPAATNTTPSSDNDDDKKSDDDSDNKTTENVEATPTSKAPASITGGASATDDGALTVAPSLTRGPKTTSYPPPSPPPVADAPFMHRSTAPQGTVFIAVGAILGAFAIAVIAWRGIIACLLHRNVERAAAAQYAANDKAALFALPSAPFYQQTAPSASGSRLRHDSPGPNMSSSGPLGGGGMPTAGAPGTGVRRTNRNTTPSATPSMINLFYSPTATGNPVSSAGNPASQGGDRTSRYLPSGFYPAPAAAASASNLHPDSPRVASGVWSPQSAVHHHQHNLSRHSLNPSPPESPLPSPGLHHPHHLSSVSSLGLNSQQYSSVPTQPPPASPGVRAPSAFLDDLLAENPNALPPPVMPSQRGSGHGRNSSYGSGRA
jgi:hypothetical protein